MTSEKSQDHISQPKASKVRNKYIKYSKKSSNKNVSICNIHTLSEFIHKQQSWIFEEIAEEG